MNENAVSGYKLPPGVVCPKCNTTLIGASPVSGSVVKGFKKGNIVVCFHCSCILRVGDSSLIPMTETELVALPEVSQRILAIAVSKIQTV